MHEGRHRNAEVGARIATFVAPLRPSNRSLSARNVAALVRCLALWGRYPQLRGRLFYLGAGAEIRVERQAKIQIAPGLRCMRGFTLVVAGELQIGRGVGFNRGCYLAALERVVIGADCLFGEGVSIHDENHQFGPDGAGPIANRGFRTRPITIGRNVWVGAKATILQGVAIGDNAVIGAHSVVTGDVPANSVAVGIPARVVRTFGPQDAG